MFCGVFCFSLFCFEECGRFWNFGEEKLLNVVNGDQQAVKDKPEDRGVKIKVDCITLAQEDSEGNRI